MLQEPNMYTIDQLVELLEKAKNMCGKISLNDCEHLSREKPHSYFDNIFKNSIMEIHPKDGENSPDGDPQSPTNIPYLIVDLPTRPIGLLFSANILNFTGELPIFGDNRNKKKINELVARCPNMYFADFYCTPGNEPHNVTLFMTDPQSSTENKAGFQNIDDWCKEKLLPFDYSQENKLLYRDNNNKWHASSRVWIEIFFTENPVADKQENMTVGGNACGSGRNPRPKNPNCQWCNITSTAATPAQ